MRLDKYLKVSRLIKRRTVAKDAVDGEFIYVNGVLKKPSYHLKLEDLITIRFRLKEITVKVTSFNQTKTGDLMYELISEKNYQNN